MTKNLPAIPDQDKRVATALRLHGSAAASAAQMAIAAAKCGLELKALKKDAGQGAWEDFFAKNFATHGLSLRTAQRYMALADGLKSKALKNDTVSFLKLLDAPPSSMSEKDQSTLNKAVGKVTDGKALAELYQEFGIVKVPQGGAAKGGAKKKKAEATTTEAATEPAIETKSEIPEGVDPQAWQLNKLLVEGLKDGWWNDCTEAFRRELHGNLVDVVNRVGITLKKQESKS